MNRKALIAGLKAEIAALAAKGDDVTDEDLASIEAKSAEIATHEADEAKDFWTRTVVVTSKDENLTKAHVRYLESRLVQIATTANRATLSALTQQ